VIATSAFDRLRSPRVIATISERRNAPANPSSSRALSRTPERSVGSDRTIRWRSSVSSAVLASCRVPYEPTCEPQAEPLPQPEESDNTITKCCFVVSDP